MQPGAPAEPGRPHVLAARAYFPRGLLQPEGSFRFSVDSLLLASFATSPGRSPARVLDLGCGPGVVALAMLLLDPRQGTRAVGLDILAEGVEAAAENAARLGLSERYLSVTGDARDLAAPDSRMPGLSAGSFDMVVANPPYRTTSQGRLAKGPARLKALFETEGDLSIFARAGARALKPRGRMCVVYLAERLAGALHHLGAAGLEVKRLRLVHGRLDQPARLVLLEAVKGARPGLSVEPPLVLYEPGSGRHAAEALAFCPFLAANPARSGHAPSNPTDSPA